MARVIVFGPRPALDILEELEPNGVVFAGPHGRAIGKLDEPMRTISKALGVDPVTPHDLRRTHGTTITGLGFGRDAMNRIQNHKEGGIANVYDRYKYAAEEISYAVVGYTGYGDGNSTNLTDFISDEMRADWEANRDELLKFWASGEYTTAMFFPNSMPWLFVKGSADTLPWAERVLAPSRC
jgi:hypothetical protein